MLAVIVFSVYEGQLHWCCDLDRSEVLGVEYNGCQLVRAVQINLMLAAVVFNFLVSCPTPILVGAGLKHVQNDASTSNYICSC